MTEKLTLNDLPDAGEGRWWRVSFSAKSNRQPILVELMEMQVPGRKSLSGLIGWERTIASVKSVTETAEMILARVADYRLVIGEYVSPTHKEKN